MNHRTETTTELIIPVKEKSISIRIGHRISHGMAGATSTRSFFKAFKIKLQAQASGPKTNLLTHEFVCPVCEQDINLQFYQGCYVLLDEDDHTAEIESYIKEKLRRRAVFHGGWLAALAFLVGVIAVLLFKLSIGWAIGLIVACILGLIISILDPLHYLEMIKKHPKTTLMPVEENSIIASHPGAFTMIDHVVAKCGGGNEHHETLPESQAYINTDSADVLYKEDGSTYYFRNVSFWELANLYGLPELSLWFIALTKQENIHTFYSGKD